MYHRPNRIRRPGNAVNTTEIGAAPGSFGVSLTSARARSRPLASFSSKPNPSARSTSKSLSSRSMMANIAVCNGRKRSGLVTRLYAGSVSVRDASPVVPYTNHPGVCLRFKCGMRARRRALSLITQDIFNLHRQTRHRDRLPCPRYASLLIDQVRQCLTRYSRPLRRARDHQAQWFQALVPYNLARMGRVAHTHWPHFFGHQSGSRWAPTRGDLMNWLRRCTQCTVRTQLH